MPASKPEGRRCGTRHHSNPLHPTLYLGAALAILPLTLQAQSDSTALATAAAAQSTDSAACAEADRMIEQALGDYESKDPAGAQKLMNQLMPALQRIERLASTEDGTPNIRSLSDSLPSATISAFFGAIVEGRGDSAMAVLKRASPEKYVLLGPEFEPAIHQFASALALVPGNVRPLMGKYFVQCER